MRSAIVAEANVNVTDEEAVQKHMQYVEFDYTTSSGSSDSSDTTVSDDEKKQVKEKAAAFAEGAKTAEDFASYATEQGTEAKDATFDSDSVSPSKEVVKAADKLGEGELTGVVESDTACYVAKVTSLNDEAATETKKQSLLTETIPSLTWGMLLLILGNSLHNKFPGLFHSFSLLFMIVQPLPECNLFSHFVLLIREQVAFFGKMQ